MSTIDLLYKIWPIVGSIALLGYYSLWMYFEIKQLNKEVETLKTSTGNTDRSVAEMKNLLTSIDERLQILVSGYVKK